MNKVIKKSSLKRLASIGITFIFALSFVALSLSGLFVFANDTQPMSANVTYFAGYGESISDSNIHDRTRIPLYTGDAPSITIFNHGQGGNASHWSNDGNGNLAYDTVSLVEKLRNDAGGANVYWARMSKDTDGDGKDDNFTHLKPKTITEPDDTYEQFYSYSPRPLFFNKTQCR